MTVSRVPEAEETMLRFGEDLKVLCQTAASLDHMLADFRVQLGRLSDKYCALETKDHCRHEATMAINGHKKKVEEPILSNNGVYRGAQQQLQNGSPQLSPKKADKSTLQPNPLSANQSILCAVADAVGEENYLFFATVSKTWLAAWNSTSTSTSMIMDSDKLIINKNNRNSIDGNKNKQHHQWRAAPMTRAVTPDTTRSQLTDCFNSGLRKQPRICQSLAALGRLDLLRWARVHHGCPLDKSTSTRAALGGHLEVLAWAYSNGCPLTPSTCAAAAAGGHLDVLKWARANGCPWDSSTCSVAALKGQMDVLRWALANRCPCDPETCAYAAEGGHLGLLQWARANGCPWDERTCAAAAGTGRLDVLSWARENGCPWDEGTCLAAAGGGNLEVLQWARENGCSWDEEACLTMLFEFGRGVPHRSSAC